MHMIGKPLSDLMHKFPFITFLTDDSGAARPTKIHYLRGAGGFLPFCG